MNRKIRDTIAYLVAEVCFEEYNRTKKMPNVTGLFSEFLESNTLIISNSEVYEALLYQTSQTFQNLILERQTRWE